MIDDASHRCFSDAGADLSRATAEAGMGRHRGVRLAKEHELR